MISIDRAAWRAGKEAGASWTHGGMHGCPHRAPSPADNSIALPRIEVRRDGRMECYQDADPDLSSAPARWSGIALEEYSTPRCIIPCHEHVEHFVHVVLAGSTTYEVLTRGKVLKFHARPGTTFIRPRGTVDEVRWSGPTHRIAAAIHPQLLVNALDETTHATDIELTEHWNLNEPNIMSVMLAMKTDLDAGSPSGPLYGESLANALAVYLLKRYAVTHYEPTISGGGLPRYRLKRVLDYVGENFCRDVRLAQLAAVACMSPHYFAEMFRQSTGCAPHRYVLLRRIDLAKIHLRDAKRSVIEVGLEAGFPNPSHFARVFRKFVGVSPTMYRAKNYVR